MIKWRGIKNTAELKGVKTVKLKVDNRKYHIHTIYDAEHLSLCLYGYNDAEQDFQTHVSEIEVKK